jgi:hypothetical protein
MMSIRPLLRASALLVCAAAGSCSTGSFDYQPNPIGGGGGGPAVGSYGDPVLDRPLTGCALPAFARAGDFETGFFAPRCGRGVVCHANPLYPPNLKDPAAYLRLVDRTVAYPKTMCDATRDKYIDRAAGPEGSFLVAKARDVPPRCPSGTSGGLPMPFDGIDRATPDEVTCLVAYIKAVTQK